MRKSSLLTLVVTTTVLLMGWTNTASSAASRVKLYDEMERPGFVIVRQFDEAFVTILMKIPVKIYQFKASKVQWIENDDAVLIGEDIDLKADAKADAEVVTPLLCGQEVELLGEEKEGWVHVKAWGDNTGWIPKDILVKRVIRKGDGKEARFIRATPKTLGESETSQTEEAKPENPSAER